MTESLSLKMEPVKEFCMRVDAYNLKKVEFLQYFREIGTLDTKSTRIDDLNPEELDAYNTLLEAELNARYVANWR